jgi:hypothetical protein
MGFYYGSSQPPPEDDKQGSLKDALLITLVVFRTLALPVGILIGALLYLVLLFVLFSLHPLAGLGGILLIVAPIAGRALWEWKHPPTLKS